MEANIIYLSPEGLAEAKKELEHLTKTVRPEIIQQISDAREMGDLSENFAYHDARDRQGQNEARIAQLEEMVRSAVIVQQGGRDAAMIRLGTAFRAATGSTSRTFTIVGENEASPMEGKISNLSPLGNAFLGRTLGDDVEIVTPSGKVTYHIEEIF